MVRTLYEAGCDKCWHLLKILLLLHTGNILGITKHHAKLVRVFRKMRRAGYISEFVSISPNHQYSSVHIASDGGRVCRCVWVWAALTAVSITFAPNIHDS